DPRDPLHVAWQRRTPVATLDDRRDVLGRRAAATADDAHTVLRDELLVRLGEAVRAERIDGDAAVVLRDARVRDHADRQRGVLTQVADGLAHVLGPRRAVEPDHVRAHVLDDRR